MLSLFLWFDCHKWKSQKWGLKLILLIPCERTFYTWLAGKKSVGLPPGRIIEMHLNTYHVYNRGRGCREDIGQFKSDLEKDLKLVKNLSMSGKLGRSPVIVLNTFNRHWLKATQELLGGKRFPGVLLAEISSRLYSPKRHKEIFKGLFPECTLRNPGRKDPEKWDLIISPFTEKAGQ